MGGGRDATAFGAAIIVGGMVVLGFTDTLVRVVANEAGLWQFHLTRSGMALPLLVVGAAVLGLPLRARRPGAVAIRAGVQTLSMLLFYAALAAAPAAQVGAALFTAPLWVLIFAAGFFGRPIGPSRMLAVALGFAGVLVMLRPDAASLSAMTLAPVAAGALYGLGNLLTREWCGEEPVGALLLSYFGGLGLAGAAMLVVLAAFEPPAAWAEAAPFIAAGWRAPSLLVLGVVLVQAAGALVAVGMVARGYQSGDTSTLAVFEYSYVLSVAAWAYLLWGERLGPLDLLGMAMIVSAGAIVALAPAPPPSRRSPPADPAA
ncbi:MAG: DMT family transporter [Amaricoccus sp.]|nr:DMT family transporter [Amaricoccus sp.]